MKIISMIPARYSASRFPGKLMQDLEGKTVILRTYEATVSTGLFDDVFVVTDSEIIFKEIVNNGGKAIMSIKEHECGSDRIAEAIEFMEDVDVVVNVQGDEPFTEVTSLKKLIDVFQNDDKKQIDLASLMVHITDYQEINNPNTVKVITDSNNFALYFSRSPIPFPRDKSVNAKYFKHKGVYAFRRAALLDFYRLPMLELEASEKIECIRYLEYSKKIKMVETNVQGVEIDTPEDLERAKKTLEIDYKNIKVIGFDADDTLWVNETYFRDAEVAFGKLLSKYETLNKIDQELFKMEMKNLPLYGYGVKGFVLSMIEMALEISNNNVSNDVIHEIINIGKNMINKPVELLEGVEDVLKGLSNKYRLILATKGDLLDQERKLEKSGLLDYFHHIEVLSDKKEANYSKLLNHLDINPSEFLMIGNSLKSDILPLINIKAHAIHVPFHTTWLHEEVDEDDKKSKQYKTVGSLLDILSVIN